MYSDLASTNRFAANSTSPFAALSFASLELGLMALGLGICFALESRLRTQASHWNPLSVYGQTALAYYMLHFLGLGALALAWTGDFGQRGLAEAYLAAAGALVVLYPVCVAWRRYKWAHPRGWPQYL